jgi:oligopeptide/dipeptide ABC transporter ATP-binding protein
VSLVEVRSVTHSFRGQRRPALIDANLSFEPGDIVAVVGESGCGKSTLGRVVSGLISPQQGEVRFRGAPLDGLDKQQRKAFHRRVQLVHQDPFASLNPSLPLRVSLGSGARYHRIVSRRDLDAFLLRLLKQVGMDDTVALLDRYPHQLSGGQRQRVAIARAVGLSPELIVADEVVSMLDVSLRVSILDLMLEFQREQNVAFMFISHDFGVVRYFAASGRVVVMFYGAMVEEGLTEEVIKHPAHPYTQALLAAIPTPARRRQSGDYETVVLDVDRPVPKTGCPFRDRCPYAVEQCANDPPPPLTPVRGRHRAACWLAGTVGVSKGAGEPARSVSQG